MASNNITLSPKYGVNPTIPVCFWCGESKSEIALLGHIGDGRKHEDFEAPRYSVINYEPCDKCRAQMAQGFTVMEATTKPNRVSSVEIQKGVYPTGRYVVLKNEAAERIFGDLIKGNRKAFLPVEAFSEMFCGGANA